MRKLLRRVATDAIVLLKNDGPTLPLSPDGGKLAIIGPLARTAVINGGGSASLMPYYAVTPEQGVRAAVSEETEVEYHVGTYAFKVRHRVAHRQSGEAQRIGRCCLWMSSPATSRFHPAIPGPLLSLLGSASGLMPVAGC